MAPARTLTIETRGEWSPRQARAILDAIRDEAATLGLHFKAIDITTHSGPSRVLLVPFCLRHDKPIAAVSACAVCLQESRRVTARPLP